MQSFSCLRNVRFYCSLNEISFGFNMTTNRPRAIEGTPENIINKLIVKKKERRVAKAKLITLYLDTFNSHETSSSRLPFFSFFPL